MTLRYPLLRLLALLALAPLAATAQTPGVGIGTTAPHSSAALDVSSTSKGLLPPRMTQTERNTIGSPAAGLTIYNTTTNKLNTWNGTSWTEALTTTEAPYQAGAAVTFTYTGAEQLYTVPADVHKLSIDASGAQGAVNGGLGGRVQTTLSVTPGEVLRIYVGGAGGQAPNPGQGGAGYNGGGDGRVTNGGGGGGSDIRRGGSATTDRIVVAGGGGGTASAGGGAGGDLTGVGAGGNFPGQGGTQSAGGAGGSGVGNGAFFQGGAGNFSGGGGGWYGGGGGGGGSGTNGGGGGGSSYVTTNGASATVHTQGYRSGHGIVVITPAPIYAAPALDASNFVNLPSGADNLGNHTATQNLNLGTNALVGTTAVNVGSNLNLGTSQLVGNGGTSGLGITSAGRVGIGTTAPLSLLSLSQATSQSNTPNQTLGELSFVGFNRPNASASIQALSPGWDDVSHLLFKTSDGAAAPTERLRITSTGNVGIGTTAPQATLHVVGSTRLSSLAGSGSRMVTTDNSGTLTTAALPTDQQTLSISGSTITISGSNSTVTLPAGADNLGNHTATQNLNLGTSQLVGNGGSSGLSVSAAGNPTAAAPQGIQLSALDRPLITRGYDPFTNGNYTGAGRWGLFMESGALKMGVPALANRQFQWATYNDNSSVAATLMTLTQEGKLGIGTTAPLSGLSISQVTSVNNTPGQTVGELTFVGFNRPWASASIQAQSPAFDDASHLLFSTSNGGAVPTERLRITATGNVGIGTSSPALTALLDLSSTTKGFLPPRMTLTQRDAIASPATGLLIYNTTTNNVNVWDGVRWTEVGNSQEVLAALAPPATTTFRFTGAMQTYTVPAGVTQLRVTAAGAASFHLCGGNGGTVTTTLAVTPGEVLNLFVGSRGGSGLSGNTAAGGWNGGGTGLQGGHGGGGATDIRRGGTALADRVVVAGGGGAGNFAFSQCYRGGAGGGPDGGDAMDTYRPLIPGTGATQISAGSPGGSLGQGATGNSSGGGGGGYYGGGSPGSFGHSSSGGGGSSWVNPATTISTSYVAGNNNDDGYLSLGVPVTASAAAVSGANVQTPQLTQTQRDALAPLIPGLLIYNLTTGLLNLYTGTTWVEFLATTPPPSPSPAAQTYYATGGLQTYTVPAGVTQITLDAQGAQGGMSNPAFDNVPHSSGGVGARVRATLTVTPGQVLNLYVGGVGPSGFTTSVGGGYNGGAGSNNYGAGGGGATDVRIGGTALTNRVLVAGGGGGGGGGSAYVPNLTGGAGGLPNGGAAATVGAATGGTGGTQTTGGNAGGSLGVGGGPVAQGGGGGGGGYYGGGGGNGAGGGSGTGGGGGGSSWVAPAFSSVSYSAGTTGGGSITIAPAIPLPAPTISGANFQNIAASNLSGVVPAASLGLTPAAGGVVFSDATGLVQNAPQLYWNNSTNRLGLGTATPNATLEVNGSTRLTGLAGTGSRMVTADPNGTLAAAPLPTDAQQLTKAGNVISLTNGGSVTDTDTDQQTLSITGSTITISGSGSAVTVPSSADNLGNHTATQNLSLGANTLVGNGGSSGLTITSSGNVGIGATATQKLDVAGNIAATAPLGVLLSGLDRPLITRGYDRFTSGSYTGAGRWGLFMEPNSLTMGVPFLSGRQFQWAAYNDNSVVAKQLMTLDLNANLGIGTTPLTTLSLSDVPSQRDQFGQIIGELSFVGFNRPNPSASILAESPGWDDVSHLIFKTSNSAAGAIERVRITADGKVGIGTGSPDVPLDVEGTGTLPSQSFAFYRYSGGTSNTGAVTGAPTVSIRANGAIMGAEFYATSDRRLKTIVGRSDNATDLTLLNQLRITDYRMRDRVVFGDRLFKKVIAQEVEAVLPQAVTKQTSFLPDVYAATTTMQSEGDSLLILTLPAGLPEGGAAAGQRLKLIGEKSQVLAIVARPAAAGARTLTVRGAQALAREEVFVYGLEHADVRAVDYEALSMLNVSATQELARQVEWLKVQNAALQVKSARADADHAALQTLQEQMARLLGEAPPATQAHK